MILLIYFTRVTLPSAFTNQAVGLTRLGWSGPTTIGVVTKTRASPFRLYSGEMSPHLWLHLQIIHHLIDAFDITGYLLCSKLMVI